MLNLAFFTTNFSRCAQSSSFFAKTFLYVREACKYIDKGNYFAMYRKNNISIGCVLMASSIYVNWVKCVAVGQVSRDYLDNGLMQGSGRKQNTAQAGTRRGGGGVRVVSKIVCSCHLLKHF